MVAINPVDILKYPNCHSGYQYALDCISGKQIANKYIIGACYRFIKDFDNELFWFDWDRAERYLKLTQKFLHTKGSNWKTKNITYEPWQNFAFMNILGWIDTRTNNRRFRVAHVEVPRGQGKAHPLDQVVPTPDGFKTWSQIEVGSKLYSRDGKICRVVGKTPIEKHRLYLVRFSDGSEIKCSSGHLWVTSNKTERDRQNHHKLNPPKRRNKFGELIGNFSYESPKETIEIFKTVKFGKESNHLVKNSAPVEGFATYPLNPYFLGYWIGNGSKSAAKVTCHLDDVGELTTLFKERGMNISVVSPKENTKGVDIRFIEVSTLMKELGLLGREKHFKDEWLLLPIEQRLELLRGLLDSDGTLNPDTTAHFYTSELQVAEGVKKLICSLGYKATIRIKNVPETNNYKTEKTHYLVAFTPRGDTRVFNLPRKYNKQVSQQGGHDYCSKRYITEVVETDKFEEMFCVEVDSADHTYLVGESYIPTHNSANASQLALYFLALDNPVGNEISCVASKTDQARIVLDSSRAMAKGCPDYLKATGVEVLAHKVVHEKSNSVLRALSSESKSLDGLNDVLSIIDELHAVDKDLFEVIYSGLSKRNDSLLFCITTAGASTDSIGYSQSVYAKKVALGEVEDNQFFSLIYTIDEGDDIHDECTWRKANPGFGVSVDPITFAAKIAKTKVTPADLPNVLTKHFNVWISEAKAYYDLAEWDKGYDPDFDIGNFRGEKCYVGVDLASKVDLTALVYVFRKTIDNVAHYYIWDRSYLPEDSAKKASSTLFDDAIARDYLIATPGQAIHYPRIEEDFRKYAKDFRVEAAHFDPWSATQFAQNLLEDGFNMVEFRMNTSNLSEPTKALDALIREGRIHHNGSPLMRWCLGNVVAKEDAAGNVFPRKSHEKLKIDLAVALIIAMAGWINAGQEESVYSSRGILVL